MLAAGWAHPDVGLFLGTYIGYWLVGLAMLAIGMVASFLTGNITIGFVLGVLFNVPLVFLRGPTRSSARSAGKACWPSRAGASASSCADFGRGVLSLAGLAYFLADRGGHALREHGADRPAALVQRPRAAGRWSATSPSARWPWS